MTAQNPKKAAPKPAAADPLRVDPGDARLYARRMKEARRAGPLAKFFRYAAILLLLAGAVAAFLNYETLMQVRLDFSELTGLFKDEPSTPGTPGADGELGTEVVEQTGVAGVPGVLGSSLNRPVSSEKSSRTCINVS
jgi:hypothetical protein